MGSGGSFGAHIGCGSGRLSNIGGLEVDVSSPEHSLEATEIEEVCVFTVDVWGKSVEAVSV